MASSSLSIPTFQSALLHKSQFLGQDHIKLTPQRSTSTTSRPKTISTKPTISAKFNLYEILGGRGLCNGEEGIEKELKKDIQPSEDNNEDSDNSKASSVSKIDDEIPEDGFDKELLGLTGGFPGGETGLQKFLEKNPPPLKIIKGGGEDEYMKMVLSSTKPKAPGLPLLLPGMIALVKNPSNPYYMYCGVVQRITDGKAGVLFEGGNWDRLITFRLDELERREKGPPMVNPKSVVLEPLIEKLEKQSSSS